MSHTTTFQRSSVLGISSAAFILTYLLTGGGGLLTPRKIGFEGGPGKRGNRYQALSGEGASGDEHEAYPYEDESSALLYGGG